MIDEKYRAFLGNLLSLEYMFRSFVSLREGVDELRKSSTENPGLFSERVLSLVKDSDSERE